MSTISKSRDHLQSEKCFPTDNTRGGTAHDSLIVVFYPVLETSRVSDSVYGRSG